MSTTYSESLAVATTFYESEMLSFEDFLRLNPRRADVYEKLKPVIYHYIQTTTNYIRAVGAQKDAQSIFGDRVVTIITVTCSKPEEEQLTSTHSKSMRSTFISVNLGAQISELFFRAHFYKELHRNLLFNPLLVERRFTSFPTCSVSIVGERKPPLAFSKSFFIQIKIKP